MLYGRKPPEPEAAAPTPISTAPAAPAAPVAVAPAAPVVPPAAVVAPAPTPATPEAAKVEEKGKDLDRKMNQLFK